MNYTIEKGVPIPQYGSKYPFAEMGVGDSFAVPEDQRVNVTSNAASYQRRHGNKVRFSVRKHEGQIRVWRTA